VNTYSVVCYPEGWSSSSPAPVFVVQAKEFLIDADYIVFVDDEVPQKAVFAVPHAAVPVVTRTAAG
jgi:hypothetical protein